MRVRVRGGTPRPVSDHSDELNLFGKPLINEVEDQMRNGLTSMEERDQKAVSTSSHCDI
jgi:hypothetical protein